MFADSSPTTLTSFGALVKTWLAAKAILLELDGRGVDGHIRADRSHERVILGAGSGRAAVFG